MQLRRELRLEEKWKKCVDWLDKDSDR